MSDIRIWSGGQSGVDRAALDAALLTGFTYEGWCPKGGIAEDFPEPPGLLRKYPRLKETPSALTQQRTEWNIRDSASTLVLVPNSQFRSPGTSFAIECAKGFAKPCAVIPYLDEGAEAQLQGFISSLDEGSSVNIAGPREGEHPGAYEICLRLLTSVLGRWRALNSTLGSLD